MWQLAAAAASAVNIAKVLKLGPSIVQAEEEPKKKSVLIVGGGIMGLGTAFHLAEKGHKVTIVERNNETASVCCLKDPCFFVFAL